MENIKPFIYHISPEREVILVENTKKKLAREEGEAIGETRGISKGRTEEKMDIAINMLENNYSVEEIAKLTHLSIDEIKKINKNNK